MPRIQASFWRLVCVGHEKCAPPFKEAEFDIRWGTGIDSATDLVDFASSAGVLEKAGSHLSFEGEHIGQGRERARETLMQRADLADSVRRAALAAGGGELNGAAH